jgi:uncharacterized RmlC-like cupin family protein
MMEDFMTTTHSDVRITESDLPVVYESGLQDQPLAPVVHAGIAPVTALSAGLVRMPGGHTTKAHRHVRSEVIVHVTHGMAASLVGTTMTPVLHPPGSLVYIGAGLPHAAVNLYPHTTDPDQVEHTTCHACETRTDPLFDSDVDLLPDLDELVAERAAQLRLLFSRGLLDRQLQRPRAHLVTP